METHETDCPTNRFEKEFDGVQDVFELQVKSPTRPVSSRTYGYNLSIGVFSPPEKTKVDGIVWRTVV